MPFMTWATPVSYTHLDVYKRQAVPDVVNHLGIQMNMKSLPEFGDAEHMNLTIRQLLCMTSGYGYNDNDSVQRCV